MNSTRSGVLAGGNFIVDTIMRVDRFPDEQMLANIIDEARANGGGPYNVLRDLAAMRTNFPLAAIGLVGDDENGAWIRKNCIEHGIDVNQLHVGDGMTTSYTQVITVAGTGRRTFFHRRGANSELDVHHFDFSRTNAKIFHYAYFMLLDRLDAVDADGISGAARVLKAAHESGLVTSADSVSVDNADFRATILNALPWVDHLILNEVEASRFLNCRIPADDPTAITVSAERILACGVNQAVVIHTELGVVAATRDGTFAMGSLELPEGFSQGSNGAGDAFAAGYLYGVHEGWDAEKRLKLGVCAAASCLADPSPSGGILPVEDCLSLSTRHPHRSWK